MLPFTINTVGGTTSAGYAVFDTDQDQRPPVRLLLDNAKKQEIIQGFRTAGITSKEQALTFLMRTTGRPIADLTKVYDVEAAKILTELRRLSRPPMSMG